MSREGAGEKQMKAKVIPIIVLILLLQAIGPLMVRPASSAETPYDVTIWSWDYIDSWNSVPITMDGVATGYSTSHTFTGLTGTHNFTIPSTDPSGHPFSDWDTGGGNIWTDETLTLSSGGTYTARYRGGYSVTIWSWQEVTGWNSVPITMDGVATGYSTSHTFSGLTGTHYFTVPGSIGSSEIFYEWDTGTTSPTIAVSASGVYTAHYREPALVVSPKSNAPNTPITLSGSKFKANALVDLSYTNPVTLATVPIATGVQADASGTFEYSYNAPDLKQALASGDNTIVTNIIIFTARDTATGTSYTTATGFSQSARGLLQVKRTGPYPSEQLPSTGNMFGNLTDFTLTGSLPVTNIVVSSNIIIAGNRFYPGSATLKWDNNAVLSTPTVDGTGFFNTTVTVPITPIGLHNVTMVDANGQKFIIFFTVVPSVTLSPNSGQIGATVTVTGYGFPASWGTTKVNATLYWPGLSGYIASALTDSSGAWTSTFIVPQSVVGAVTLTAYQNVTGSFVSTATATFMVTKKAPTGSIVINGGEAYTTSTSVTLSLTYLAYNYASVSNVRYSNDGTWDSETWETPVASKSWTLLSGDGSKTVYFQVKDSDGTLSSTYNDAIALDTTSPTGSITINVGATYANTTVVSLTLSSTDTGSGISQMCFQNEVGAWSSWEPYATSKSWSLTTGDGSKTVYVQYKDNAGLTVVSYDLIVLDTTLPVANAGQNQTAQVWQSVTFNGGGSSDNNGIASYLWNFGDGNTGTGVAPTHTYSSYGNYTVTLRVIDVAGNSATVNVEVFIPEFSPTVALLLFVMFVTLASVLRGKLKPRKYAI
jgi:hypothetical protein